MAFKKGLFLFLGLLLPVLIFIFLKVFGKNEFDVPLPFENGVTQVAEECKVSYPAPYVLPDSIFKRLPQAKLVIINYGNESLKLSQIKETFKPDIIEVKGVEEEKFIKSCVYLIQSPNTIVLIDDSKRIRGHYDGEDRDELDRLEAEIKIILKKY